MPYNDHHHHEGTCPECDVGPYTRNAYWTGKLMLARDFIDEQRYMMTKLRHHNRTLHGSGVVCGLKVVPDEKSECQNRYLWVEPGVAIDSCGREIVLRQKERIDLWSVPEIQTRRESKEEKKGTYCLLICIGYDECPTEEVPRIYQECGCEDDHCAPNRILESAWLHARLLPSETPVTTQESQGDCYALFAAPLEGCSPHDQDDCVELATIANYTVDSQITDESIDNMSARHYLPSVETVRAYLECQKGSEQLQPSEQSPPTLTHISGVNWITQAGSPGNSKVTLAEVKDGLTIHFDSEVKVTDLHRHSIRVFREESSKDGPTQWSEMQGDLQSESVGLGAFDPQRPPKEGRFPVQTKAVTFVPGKSERFEKGETYRVVVVGDFIRGRNQLAVDADHLPPWLGSKDYRTGDGIAGGTFESWFTIENVEK